MNDLVIGILLRLFALFAFIYLLAKFAGFLLDSSIDQQEE